MPDDTRTPAERAYAAWFRLTYPLAGGVVPDWQLLEPATRALWEHIAQAAREVPCREVPHAADA